MISLTALKEHAAVSPDAVAVADDLQSLTWSDLAISAERVRAWLTRVLDDAIANRALVIAGNTARVIVATSALASLGIPWVGVDPAQDAAIVTGQLRAVDPTVIIIDSSLPGLPADRWPRLTGAAVVLDVAAVPRIAIAATHYPTAAGSDHQPAGWRNPPFLALGFTSGTTGAPKLFVRRSRAENQRVAFLRDRLLFTRGDSFLITSPLAFASGHVWATAALSLGGSVRLGPADPRAAIELISRDGLTGGFFVPPFLDQVLEAATTTHADADLSRLRFVLTGGRHLSPRSIRQAAERLGGVLYLYYATTETGINTMAGPEDLAADPYSSGRCMPGVTVRALDPGTLRELPPGQAGLLAIDTGYAVEGYLHRSLDTVSIGGRRHILTSDYGCVSDGGSLRITARSAGQPSAREAGLDVVRTEGALKEDPAVRDACVTVTSWEHPHGEQRAVAAVVLRPELTQLARERALRRAADALGHLAGRCTLAEVSRIPYNSAGKVSTRELRQELNSPAISPRDRREHTA